MSEDKKITIRAGLDSSTLERDFQALEERLKRFHQQQSRHEQNAQVIKRVTQDPNLGRYAKAAFDRTDQEHRAGIQKENEKLQKQIEVSGKQAAATKSVISALEQEIKATKMSDDALKAKLNTIKQLNEQLKQHDRIVLNSSRELEAKGGIPQTEDSSGGGKKSSQEQEREFKEKMSKVTANVLKMAGGIAAITSTIGALLTHRASRDREVLGATASTAQIANTSFHNVMQGQGWRNFFEADERRSAFDMAMRERSARLASDPISAAGRVLTAGVGGGIGGAMVGGPWGAAGGAILGMGHEVFGNKGVFNQIFDRDAYKAQLNKDTMANFQANLESQKILHPQKYAAAETFSSNFQQFQNLQRAFNLSDKDLFGEGYSGSATRRSQNYLGGPDFEAVRDEQGNMIDVRETDKSLKGRQSAIDIKNSRRARGMIESQMTETSMRQTGVAGHPVEEVNTPSFSRERIIQNLNEILQAGGNTVFAKEGGGRLAAQYQRAGLSSAAGQLGQIAGFGGDLNTTEQKYIRLLSEGTKIGINASKMPEEMRQWTAAATQLFMQTGGAAGAVSVLAQGMGGTSAQDIKAAQSAYQTQNQESGESTGPRGAMKWAYLSSGQGAKDFEGVSEKAKAWATEANISNLNADDYRVKEIADQMGVSPEEALNRIRKMQQYGQNLSGDADKAGAAFSEGLEKYIKDNEGSGKGRAELMYDYAHNTKEGQRLAAQASFATSYERTNAGQANDKEALANLGIQYGKVDFTKIPKGGNIKDQFGGRLTDTGEASTSSDQVAQLVNLAGNVGLLNESMMQNVKETMGNKLALDANTKVIDTLTKILEGKATDQLLNSIMETARKQLVMPGNENKSVVPANTKDK